MLRATTLLIVIVLAGGPMSSLVCEAWCSRPAAGNHHREVGCHDASASAPEGQQIEAAGGCHDAAAVAPYLLESRQTEFGTAATDAAVVELGLTSPAPDRMAAGWSVFTFQPPRGLPPHSVLRI